MLQQDQKRQHAGRSAMVARPRPRQVIDRLLADHVLVWIGAKAGSGKTTVAEEWRSAGAQASVWLPLAVTDSDPGRFFARLGKALAATCVGDLTLRTLTREHLANPDAFARLWFADLATGSNPALVVVLDDAQGATDALERWLRCALQTPYLGLRWLVLSRTAMPAGLERAVLAGQAASLGGETLAFTAAECRALLRRRGLPEAHAVELMRRTAGWPAALAAIVAAWVGAGKRAEATAEPLVMPEALARFVDAEILRDLDAAGREVLFSCCTLPRVRDAWAVQLSGRDDAPAVLERLVQRQLLLRRLPDGAYTMHALLREVLEAQLAARVGHARRRLLLARSAQLLADAGDAEAALELQLQGQEWDGANERLHTLAPAALAAARHASVARWASTIPAAARSAWSHYWLGQASLLANPAQGRAHLEVALDAFGAGEHAARLRAVAAIIGTYFQDYSATAPLRQWLERLRELAPDFDAIEDAELRAAVAVAAFSAVFMREPSHADLDAWIARLERMFATGVDPNLRIRGAMLLAKHYWYSGQYERLQPLAARVAPPLDDPRVLPYARLVWQLFLQYDAWAHGDMARGLAAMDKGLALAASSGIHLLDNHLMIHGACFALAQGRRDDAYDLLQRAGSRRTADRPMEQWHHAVSLSWWHATSGDLASAASEAQVALAAGTRIGPSPACLALVALAYAQPGESTFAALQAAGATTENRYVAWHLHVLRGQFSAAAAVGARHALVRVLHADRIGLADLASAALRDAGTAGYGTRLIADWRLAPPPAAAFDASWPWPVRITTLGRFAVDASAAASAVPRKTPTRQHAVLQAIVALGPSVGGPVAMSALADAIWPEADGDTALHACEMALHRLRGWLGEDTLVVRDQKVALATSLCWVDAWELAHRLDRLEQAIGRRLPVAADEIARAIELYRGEFLAAVEAPWAARRREALQRRFIAVLTQVASQDRDDRISDEVQALLARLAARPGLAPQQRSAA